MMGVSSAASPSRYAHAEYRRAVPGEPSSARDEVRTAEVIASLCLATDLGMGFPFGHGLHSTLFALRLADRLGVDSEIASQTYYGCLLAYVGCTAEAEEGADLFTDGATLRYFNPVMFGTPAQTMAGIVRALAASEDAAPIRAFKAATRLPKAVRGHRRHVAALCEVSQMLSDRLGTAPAVRNMFAHLTERWDGKGEPSGLRGEAIPLPLRIIHVARDAALQRLLASEEYAARVVRARAGAAFDPAIAARFVEKAEEILVLDDKRSAWDEVLDNEPTPWLTLQGEAIDRALGAMGDFADLASKYLVGHAAGVAELAGAAALQCGFPANEVTALRRVDTPAMLAALAP
jgi:hypothetical protein